MLSKVLARTTLRRAAVSLAGRRSVATLSRAAAAVTSAQRPAAAAARAALRVPVRAFATKGKAAPPAVAKPAPATAFAAVKTELAQLLQQEEQSIAEVGFPADHPYNTYIKENGLTVQHNAEGDFITVTKSIFGYDVQVLFRAQPDPEDDAEGENADADAEAEGKNEKDASGEEDGADDSYNYSFIVNVTPQGVADAPTLTVFAVSAKENKLWFEGITAGAKPATLDGGFPATDFNELSEKLQDKIADFMDALKVDEEFAQFIPAVVAETARLNALKQVQGLRNFVTAK